MGSPNVFVRFAHCNLACSIETEGWSCDTEFDSYQEMTGEEIVEVARIAAREFAEDGCAFPMSVIFTGGEPALQLDQDLVDLFHVEGWFIAIETNGIKKLPHGIDWVSLSPKTAGHTIRIERADEIRYVRKKGQDVPQQLPVSMELEGRLFMSPAFGPDGLSTEDLAWCIDLVKRNPGWRLSLQAHKLWGIP